MIGPCFYCEWKICHGWMGVAGNMVPTCDLCKRLLWPGMWRDVGDYQI